MAFRIRSRTKKYWTSLPIFGQLYDKFLSLQWLDVISKANNQFSKFPDNGAKSTQFVLCSTRKKRSRCQRGRIFPQQRRKLVNRHQTAKRRNNCSRNLKAQRPTPALRRKESLCGEEGKKVRELPNSSVVTETCLALSCRCINDIILLSILISKEIIV